MHSQSISSHYHLIKRHHTIMSGMKFVKWQQCSISGNEAICPWKTQISQVYQNPEVKKRVHSFLQKHSDLFTFTLFSFILLKHSKPNEIQVASICLQFTFPHDLLDSLVSAQYYPTYWFKNVASKKNQWFKLEFCFGTALRVSISSIRV